MLGAGVYRWAWRRGGGGIEAGRVVGVVYWGVGEEVAERWLRFGESGERGREGKEGRGEGAVRH